MSFFTSPAIPSICCLFWMVIEMRGKWLYSYYLGSISRICSKLLATSLFLSCFFSRHCIRVQVVQPYSRADTATAWKNSCFIETIRFPYG